jgi:hypothetical protein
MVLSETKKCKKCDAVKPIEAFNRDNGLKGGFSNVCRECRLEYQRAWVGSHRDQDRASKRKYDRKNRDINLAINREWRAANPERVQLSRDKWAAANPEKVAAARKTSLEKKKAETKMRRSFDLRPRVVEDQRRCSGCLRYHPKDSFYADVNVADGVSIYCKTCAKKRAREYAKIPKSRDYKKRYADRYQLKKYGLSIEDVDRMIAAQNGACAVCREPLIYGTGGCAIDHDHDTNTVRGLLCRLCNVGIGHFRENETYLNAAISYLQRTKGRKNAA